MDAQSMDLEYDIKENDASSGNRTETPVCVFTHTEKSEIEDSTQLQPIIRSPLALFLECHEVVQPILKEEKSNKFNDGRMFNIELISKFIQG